MTKKPEEFEGSLPGESTKTEDYFANGSRAGLLDEQGIGDEFIADEFDEHRQSARQPRKRIKMFCFNCNRREGHVLRYQNRWYYSYLVGFTFGLINLAGPYSCLCCGSRRLMCADWISPRYGYRILRDRRRAKAKKVKPKKIKSTRKYTR